MSPEPDSLDTWLKRVRRAGCKVNNLYQLDSGQWRANLRSATGHDFYEFGNGVDPAHAIEEALLKLGGGKAVPAPYPADDEREPAAPHPVIPDDEDDLIG